MWKWNYDQRAAAREREEKMFLMCKARKNLFNWFFLLQASRKKFVWVAALYKWLMLHGSIIKNCDFIQFFFLKIFKKISIKKDSSHA